jgi:hypothetical protein
MRHLIYCIIVFTFINPILAQDKIGFVDIDSVYEKVGFLKDNATYLKKLQTQFAEKDSIMVVRFQKNYEEFARRFEYSENYILKEKEQKKLAQEQQSIQKFEEALKEAIPYLEQQLNSEIDDIIAKELRLFGQTNNYKMIYTNKDKMLYLADKSHKGITQEIILSILKNNVWQELLNNNRHVITEKVLITFGLK